MPVVIEIHCFLKINNSLCSVVKVVEVSLLSQISEAVAGKVVTSNPLSFSTSVEVW